MSEIKNINTHKAPTVSVVMATYNGEKYIREQMDSILAQTYPFTEIIVQDDCSTDHTVDILREYAAKDNRVHLFVNDKNKGFNSNFLDACLKAKGDFIAISDQDDVWFPTKLEKQMAAIGNYPICYSSYYHGSVNDPTQCRLRQDYLVTPERAVFCEPVVGHTMLIRKQFIRRADNWHAYEPYDKWFTLQAALTGGMTFVNEPLNWHRDHSTSYSHRLAKEKGKARTSFFRTCREGYKRLKALKQQPTWRSYFSHIEYTAPKKSLARRIAQLQLQQKRWAVWALCFLCLIYRRRIYPHHGQSNAIALLWRSFFYPMIFAYHTFHFDSK